MPALPGVWPGRGTRRSVWPRQGSCAFSARSSGAKNLSFIQDKISGLNESYRTVLELCIKGCKPQKMASILGCTPGAASSRLFKARKALAEALGADFLSEHGYKLCA